MSPRSSQNALLGAFGLLLALLVVFEILGFATRHPPLVAVLVCASALAGAVLVAGLVARQVKRTESELYREKELAQVTLHSIGDGVITTDANARVEYLNPV